MPGGRGVACRWPGSLLPDVVSEFPAVRMIQMRRFQDQSLLKSREGDDDDDWRRRANYRVWEYEIDWTRGGWLLDFIYLL